MNVDSSSPSDNNKNSRTEIFQQRCEAIALLWQAGDYGNDARALQRAVDRAFAAAPDLDPDVAQRIMARAFSKLRDDLDDWVVA